MWVDENFGSKNAISALFDFFLYIVFELVYLCGLEDKDLRMNIENTYEEMNMMIRFVFIFILQRD